MVRTVQQKCLTTMMLASLFVLMGASLLFAKETCMPALELEAALIDWYGEAPVGEGPRNLVVWASAHGKTWTLVSYQPDGTACALNHGENWTGAVSLATLAIDAD